MLCFRADPHVLQPEPAVRDERNQELLAFGEELLVLRGTF
jgi:hypothetical protein